MADRRTPQWVMAGNALPDGRFQLTASKDIWLVVYQYDGQGYNYAPPPPGATLRLSVHLQQVVIVQGDTYAECFSKLFAFWSPDPVQRELPHGRLALEPGQKSLPETP
jgi:hypothetical protein